MSLATKTAANLSIDRNVLTEKCTTRVYKFHVLLFQNPRDVMEQNLEREGKTKKE